VIGNNEPDFFLARAGVPEAFSGLTTGPRWCSMVSLLVPVVEASTDTASKLTAYSPIAQSAERVAVNH
jgi:hypothetical protein